ncbi:hypothetical protein GGU10DRAFT_337465 [Lentinula aff. detonsa]|uniref:Uncharacterized protein n=1 Tax=Lentinula aff. detonsa TaxID=2804958 RepID=A0AA38L2H4_9AGAR|nr:hypothetical protein GGU10DRAFT_337465 [Lentinula aff. detonsa]
MSTRNNANTGKETTSAQEEDHGDFQTLIEKAITWKLMAKNDNCAVVLPNRLLRLATSAKESGRSKTAVNDTLDKIILIAQILQEWSWKDKSDEWRKELMEHMEEELTTRTNNICITIDGIGREARTTWKKLEEMTEKMTEVSTKIATIGNTIPDRDAQTGREEGEIENGPPKSSQRSRNKGQTDRHHLPDTIGLDPGRERAGG